MEGCVLALRSFAELEDRFYRANAMWPWDLPAVMRCRLVAVKWEGRGKG